MKSLLTLLILVLLSQLSHKGFSQAVMDEHMLALKAAQLQINEKYPDKTLNAVDAYSQIDYISIWYQMIKVAGMEDHYLSNNYIVSFHVWDEPFEKLPTQLRKQMTDPKNKEKIQRFLKHYLCYSEEPYATFVDVAEVGNVKNLQDENINIKYQVGTVQSNPPGRTYIKATANNVKFGNTFKVTNGQCISLMDFFPGTLDYFK
jgi:hypothetical protein